MLLARRLFPGLDRLGESTHGQRTLKWWTRGVTVGVSLIQSYGFAHSLLQVPGLRPGAGPRLHRAHDGPAHRRRRRGNGAVRIR